MFTEQRSLEIIFIVHRTILLFPALMRKKRILCKLERARGLNCFVCFECEHVTALENMKRIFFEAARFIDLCRLKMRLISILLFVFHVQKRWVHLPFRRGKMLSFLFSIFRWMRYEIFVNKCEFISKNKIIVWIIHKIYFMPIAI